MEYHGRRQMLSVRYLLCFIILLYPETCFLCSTNSISHPSLTCCCGVTLTPSFYSIECFSKQERMRDHKMKAFKEEQFWEVFWKQKWRLKILSISASSAQQCLSSESLLTFPSPSIPRKPFIKEFLWLNQEIRRWTNQGDHNHIIDIIDRYTYIVHTVRQPSVMIIQYVARLIFYI